ncbi:MAG TPA: LytTR family DNA-binding domain-containing protein [Bacteroidia bacterium]|jgi:two-component system LytT family response regulator|nr:LytTR family DNA-binding domain-containing protein [Bacteroidia bacterium]
MEDKKRRIAKRTDFMSVNTTQEISFIRIENIVRLEANSNYTFIFLENDRKILSSKNLKEFEQVLAPYNFLRIHKSHLVNASYISHFAKKGDGLLHLKNNYKVQVSDTGKEKFLSFFKKHSINV